MISTLSKEQYPISANLSTKPQPTEHPTTATLVRVLNFWFKLFPHRSHQFFPLADLPAKSSFHIPQGNDGDEDYDDDDDDYKTEEDNNEDVCYDDITYNSILASTLGYKSVKFVEGQKSISSSGKKVQKEPSTITHGPTSITLPYILISGMQKMPVSTLASRFCYSLV
jgi:hypothetical protein